MKKISFNKKTKITSFSSKKLDISLFWDMPSYVRFNVLKDGKFLFGSKKIIHEVKVEVVPTEAEKKAAEEGTDGKEEKDSEKTDDKTDDKKEETKDDKKEKK